MDRSKGVAIASTLAAGSEALAADGAALVALDMPLSFAAVF